MKNTILNLLYIFLLFAFQFSTPFALAGVDMGNSHISSQMWENRNEETDEQPSNKDDQKNTGVNRGQETENIIPKDMSDTPPESDRSSEEKQYPVYH
jgi:hypothetical protein